MAFMDEIKSCFEKVVKKGGEVAEIAVRKGGEVAEKAVKKGGEVAETAKLNVSLKNEQLKLSKLFTKLGKLTYDKADAAEIAAAVVEIDDVKALIESIENEIRANSGKQLCPGCGKELAVDVAFCQYCGAKIERPVAEEECEACGKADESAADEVVIVDKESDEFVKTFNEVVKKYDL